MLELGASPEASSKVIELSQESILAEVADKEQTKTKFKFGYSDQIIDVNKMFEVSLNQLDGVLN